MTIHTSVGSLQSMCLNSIVAGYNERGESVKKLYKTIPPKFYYDLVRMQDEVVNLKINNWNNPDYCLMKTRRFSIHAPLSDILDLVNRSSSVHWKTVYVDDLDWNKKYPGCRMWETASAEKSLYDYGFRPPKDVTVLLGQI